MMKLEMSLREGLNVFSLPNSEEKIDYFLDVVQLNKSILKRYPHQVSGGEIQRICIARALILEPKMLVLDEPTSMLDISVQAQILNLLKRIQKEQNLSYFYITHDNVLAKYLCDRVLYLKNKTLCE